jgi:dipeptidyl aminopeptidase/acylaminoacyl peptidase
MLSGAMSVSESGVLVYQNASSQQSQLAWFDRSGKEVAVLGETAQLSYLQLSPDGRQAAVTVQESVAANLDLWLYDTVRGGRTRVTSDPSDESSPVWSPDGRTIVSGSVLLSVIALWLARNFAGGVFARPWLGLLAFSISDLLYAWLELSGTYAWSVDQGNLLSTISDVAYFGAYLVLGLGVLSQWLFLKYGLRTPVERR